MLRLHQIFLINLTILLSIVLASVFGVSYFFAKKVDANAVGEYLPKSLELSIELLKREKEQNLDTFATRIKELTALRVTIIDENGSVLAETDKDKDEMENHFYRPEVRQAFATGSGTSVRKSVSTRLEYVYFAKKIHYGEQPLIVRVAHTTSDMTNMVSMAWLKIGFIFFLAIMVSVYVSHKINTRINGQIDQLTAYLAEIESKNFKAQLNPGVAKEFFEIAAMLRILSIKLEKKEKQKRKYTAKLKLKNRQTSDVIEAISHEFKNPVAAIMGYTETLLEDQNIDKKISNKFLEKIYANSKNISTMIDRLSLSIKFENNVLAPRTEACDILEITEEARSTLAQKYKNRQIEISGEQTTVSADRMMIKLVLINLIDNALKYSTDVVRVNIEQESASVRIAVVDKGVGIRPQDIENISKKFYRVNKNTWDNSLGLGLSLVGYILKLHATELTISSKIAEGSSFSFTLPKFS